LLLLSRSTGGAKGDALFFAPENADDMFLDNALSEPNGVIFKAPSKAD
jgi:hypothetical protein